MTSSERQERVRSRVPWRCRQTSLAGTWPSWHPAVGGHLAVDRWVTHEA